MQRMGGINSFVLSKDDRYLISVGQDKKIVVWDNTLNDPIYSTFLDEENDEGQSIDMSHDGQYVVTGGTAGVLRVYSVQLPHGVRLLSSVQGHSKSINSVAFSLSDKQVSSPYPSHTKVESW